jgi:TolA-binding protein
MTQRFTNSPFLGRAELDLGWCYWSQKKWLECQNACQAAVDRLPLSLDQATARFKLGDALLKQTNYASALAQYDAIITRYGDLPEVKTNLFERALYQEVSAGLAEGNWPKSWPAVTNALAKILAWYPNGFHADRVGLLVGQELGERGNPAGARDIFTNVLQRMPESPLSSQIGLAIARTFEQENNLPEAIAQYKLWLERFPTDAARPHAEYCLAMGQFLAGDMTNALRLMTNFVARYTNDPFRPLAQLWIADYYYRTENPIEAERIYTEIALSTNLPSAELANQAQMMAGRSALNVQGWDRAINHFTNLTSDTRLTSGTNGPKPIWVEAMFFYGDTLMSRDSTNRAMDYKDAMSVFTSLFTEIKRTQPTNQLAAAALAERADCYRQLAQLTGQLDLLTNAIDAYSNVMVFTNADIKVRSMAEVGWGEVLERQARQRPDPERLALLNQALTKYVHVFFGKDLASGEPPDPFAVKKAGLEAARLAEDLRLWPQAIQVYERLGELLPPLRASMEAKIRKAREKAGTP